MQYGLYMEGKQPGKCCASYIKSRLSVPIITVIPCNILSYSCIKDKNKRINEALGGSKVKLSHNFNS